MTLTFCWVMPWRALSPENAYHQSSKRMQSPCHRLNYKSLPLCSNIKLSYFFYTQCKPVSNTYSSWSLREIHTSDLTLSEALMTVNTRPIWPCHHQSLRTSCSTNTQQWSKAVKSCIRNTTPVDLLKSWWQHVPVCCAIGTTISKQPQHAITLSCPCVQRCRQSHLHLTLQTVFVSLLSVAGRVMASNRWHEFVCVPSVTTSYLECDVAMVRRRRPAPLQHLQAQWTDWHAGLNISEGFSINISKSFNRYIPASDHYA